MKTFKTGGTAGRERFESFEKCHFEERERREILRMAVCSRFLPSVEMTKTAVIQSSRFETVPYKHSPCSWFMVWTVPRTVRKAARSGTAPYNHCTIHHLVSQAHRVVSLSNHDIAGNGRDRSLHYRRLSFYSSTCCKYSENKTIFLLSDG